jgi:lysophospholipase L1-like esterase
VPIGNLPLIPGVPLSEHDRRPWRRYCALGDSLSEGLGDPLPGGGTRGWAALLAERLRDDEPEIALANLAVRGYTVTQALRRQLEPAMHFEPDLVTVFIGGNDVLLRPVFRPDAFGKGLDGLVAPFVERGATVVLSTLPDLTACSPMPHPFRAVLRRRLTAANTVIEDVALRYGVVLLDTWSDPRTRRHGMWSIDRIHPSADGHRLIAASVAGLLGLDVEATDMDPQSASLLDDARRHVNEMRWLLRHGAATRAPQVHGSLTQ